MPSTAEIRKRFSTRTFPDLIRPEISSAEPAPAFLDRVRDRPLVAAEPHETDVEIDDVGSLVELLQNVRELLQLLFGSRDQKTVRNGLGLDLNLTIMQSSFQRPRNHNGLQILQTKNDCLLCFRRVAVSFFIKPF